MRHCQLHVLHSPSNPFVTRKIDTNGINENSWQQWTLTKRFVSCLNVIMCCIYTYRWSYRKTFNKRPCVYLYNCLKPPAYIVTVTAFLWPPCVADAHIIFLPCSLLWPPYGIGQAIIFSSCCFFCLCSFSFFPRLISAVADRMSTILPHNGVAFVRIMMQVWNVLHAVRWKYRTQNIAKNRHLGTIAQICWAISSQLRHVSTTRKKSSNSNISSICPDNMANFGPLTAEIGLPVWAPLQISTGFASRQPYCTAL